MMVLGFFSSYSSLWFFIGFIGMLAGTLYPLYKMLNEGERFRFYLVQIGITGIATVAYLMMYLGMGVIEMGGTSVAVTRYADWLLTTPLMVATLAALSKPGTSTVAKLVGLDILVMSVGAIGPFIGFPLYWVLFLFGTAAYGAMVYLIMGEISRGPGLKNEGVNIVFTKLRNLTLVLWTLYPLVVVLSPQALGLLDIDSQALVITYLDILSKVGFAVIATRGAEHIPEISFTMNPEKEEESETQS